MWGSKYTSPCWATLSKHCYESINHSQRNAKTLCTHTHLNGARSSMQPIYTAPFSLTKTKNSSSSKLTGSSYTWTVTSTPSYSRHSAPLHCSSKNRPYTRSKRQTTPRLRCCIWRGHHCLLCSNMVLVVLSNASYPSKPNMRGQAGRHFFLSSNTVHPSEQWSHSHHCANHQERHVICSRGRTWCGLHHGTQDYLHTHHTSQTWTQVIVHAHSNRQLPSQGNSKQQGPTQMDQNLRYAILLAIQQKTPGTTPILLALRKTKFCWLFHQTLLTCSPPQQARKEFLTPQKVLTALTQE